MASPAASTNDFKISQVISAENREVSIDIRRGS